MRTITVKRARAAAVQASGCAPCAVRQREAQAEYAKAQRAAKLALNGKPLRTGQEVPWSGPLCIEGKATGDGRLMEPESLTWADLPLPLRWAPEDNGMHLGAMVVGLIEEIERDASGRINGRGFIDASGEAGREALRLMRSGLLKGVSVDLDDMDVEIRVKEEALGLGMEEITYDEETGEPNLPPPPAPDEDGYVTVMEMASDDELMVVTGARIRGATLVDIPAFAEAYLKLDDAAMPSIAEDDEEPEDDEDEPADVEGLVAAGAPVDPPAAWFADPQLAEPTPITVTDDGRYYGHIALWGTCHTGYAGQCKTPPPSRTNYAWFRTGSLRTKEGTHVAVGHVTVSTGHAGTRLTPAETVAHYDHTGRVVADVAAGEDAHGIWISGALRPGLTPAQLRAVRSAPVSGDWRTIAGHLELMAVLGVNMPGFPVPRTRALVASGVTQTLLAPAPVIGERVPSTFVIQVPRRATLTPAQKARRTLALAKARQLTEKE